MYNNGRMLDIYWRLHSKEKDLFMPHDFEISVHEFDQICKAAEQWRGEEGERRKISVYEYEWEEEYVSSASSSSIIYVTYININIMA